MFASGVDQGLIISWPRCPFFSASPYPHLHFTGYKAHKYSDTHTPGGMIQLSLQRSPPGQADLNHFTHISTGHFRYTHTHCSHIFAFWVSKYVCHILLILLSMQKKQKPLVIILSNSAALMPFLDSLHAEYLWLELMQWTWMPAPTDDRSKANSNLWDWKINVKVPPVSTWGWSQDTILEDSYVNAQLQP